MLLFFQVLQYESFNQEAYQVQLTAFGHHVRPARTSVVAIGEYQQLVVCMILVYLSMLTGVLANFVAVPRTNSRAPWGLVEIGCPE